jgi:hypothetical protein
MFLKIFHKIERERMIPHSFHEALRPKKVLINILDEHRCKTFQHNTANQVQKLIHHKQAGFIPRIQG